MKEKDLNFTELGDEWKQQIGRTLRKLVNNIKIVLQSIMLCEHMWEGGCVREIGQIKGATAKEKWIWHDTEDGNIEHIY